ncbi:M48 family metalloprotease [Dyadobacter diqingensis]|uniref:M48 family metalloprotease n=1 Tax=Dyadobacter diqingensis TaxID=2938121 RepID=UPI0020C18D14|nr:M48 family metalloprotease [Dyadobacter diqingensis]
MKISKAAFIIIPIIAIAAISSLFIFRKKQINPQTGKAQAISLSPEQEVNLGIECAPQLVAEFGGLFRDRLLQEKIKRIGRKLVATSSAGKSPYQFDFHILADSQSVSIFALPGGQIFMTSGLFKNLKTDNELAGVLSHEIGHVIGRHASEKILRRSFLDMPGDTNQVTRINYTARQTAKYLKDFTALTYDREDEIEADDLGIQYMVRAGFDPKSLVSVLQTIKENTDMAAKHPVTTDRIEKINNSIQKFQN